MPVEVCRADGSHCQPVTAASTAAVAASAEAARLAAQPLDWQFRAIEGYRIAGSTAQPGAGLEAQAIADAAGNARTALARTDLSPGQASLVKTVVERLGNEVIDGKVAPHINDEFRQGLRDLATAPAVAGPAGDRFRGALAQMTRAAQVLDQFELARGTQLGYDVGAGHNTRSAGLPVLAVENIDADLYFKTDDGVVHIESTKYGSNTLAATLKEQAEAKGAPQVERQAAWREQGTVAEPHNLRYFVLDKQTDFTGLMNPRNIAELEKAVGDAGARNIVIGDRAYSIDELKQLGADATAAAKVHVDAQRQAWVKAGNAEASFDPRAAANEFFKTNMANPDAAMRALGKSYGAAQPPLEPLPQTQLPTARHGAAFGAAAAGAVTLVQIARDGTITLDDARKLAGHTALGGAVGAVTAQGERLLVPVVDRAIGPGVQRAASQVAAQTFEQGAARAASAGVVARTIATRAVGSTAVGVVVTTGISAFENRHGLARGDPKAIGNVTADAAVGGTSILAGVAVGAAVGSVVPVAGTAVGAAAGLVVGVGIAVGAQLSGARDAVADSVAGLIDKIF